jgi:hypothetical protein
LVVLTVAAFILFTIFFSTSSVSELSTTAKDAAKHIHRPSIPRPKLPALPNIYHPFRAAVHEPPVQKNSTSGDAKWFSDWKWLNPFSSSITLDENRSVLPPLPARPPIYTFYDTESVKVNDVRDAENKLLLIWRRAWWAKGFQPVILGRAEAKQNPLYEKLQGIAFKPDVELEIMRWLAWGHMGNGILADWFTFPMGPHDDHFLSFLRRGSYPELTRYETLGCGLFLGNKKEIVSAISYMLSSKNISAVTEFLDLSRSLETFKKDPKPAGIAFYDQTILESFYKIVHDKLVTDRAKGLTLLAHLITSHLHATFLGIYTSGIAIINPKITHTAAISATGLAIVKTLNTCPESPIPHSCPPNNLECKTCEPLQLSFLSAITNSSSLFTIGTIPHPYTFQSLLARKEELTVPYIRRDTTRDQWIGFVTEDVSQEGIAGYTRIVSFKEGVASKWAASHSIWTIAEQGWSWRDLEWYFGFDLPGADSGPVVAIATGDVLMEHFRDSPSKTLNLQRGAELLATSKELFDHPSRFKQGPRKVDMRDVVEAWNLADTEAWRFVRAWEARSRMEREKWEEEERAFAGAETNGGRGDGWGRWFDQRSGLE